jgi:hypothetical protein
VFDGSFNTILHVHTYLRTQCTNNSEHTLIPMLEQIECTVLNTLQGLEYIKQYGHPSSQSPTYTWQFTSHNTYSPSKPWILLPQHNPSTQLNSATHRFSVEDSKLLQIFLTVHGPTASFKLLLPVLNPLSPFQTLGYISQIWNAFLYFPIQLTYSKFFYFYPLQLSQLLFPFYLNLMFMVPYILEMYIFNQRSN